MAGSAAKKRSGIAISFREIVAIPTRGQSGSVPEWPKGPDL